MQGNNGAILCNSSLLTVQSMYMYSKENKKQNLHS